MSLECHSGHVCHGHMDKMSVDRMPVKISRARQNIGQFWGRVDKILVL